MTRVEFAPEVTDDLERILEHGAEHGAADVSARIDQIASATDVLESNPLIGRPAREDLRALVTGRRAHGCIALYRYVPEVDTVFVLAIRAQQQAGYTRD